MARYRTVDGDMLDHICLKHYGEVTGIEEQVLKANPHLAGLGPVFSAGVIIDLIDVDITPQSENVITLWD